MICRMNSGRKIKDKLSHLINRWFFLKNQGTDDYLLTKELSPKDRLAQRQTIIKPLVDALFVYLKQHQHEVPQSGKLHDAFGYALNQEK